MISQAISEWKTGRAVCIYCQRVSGSLTSVPAPMPSLAVPKIVKPRFDEVIGLTDAVCRAHLTDEYAALARELAAALARKRPSPLMRGHRETWACGVMYTIGAVNFLFDPAQ